MSDPFLLTVVALSIYSWILFLDDKEELSMLVVCLCYPVAWLGDPTRQWQWLLPVWAGSVGVFVWDHAGSKSTRRAKSPGRTRLRFAVQVALGSLVIIAIAARAAEVLTRVGDATKGEFAVLAALTAVALCFSAVLSMRWQHRYRGRRAPRQEARP